MSIYWSTKSIASNNQKEYVVVQHKLRGFNGSFLGVRFREGYGVLLKDSKVFHNLKRNSMLKTQNTMPLLTLKNLKFVCSPKQIEYIYGKDIYYHYVQQLNEFNQEKKIEDKIEEDETHIESGLCQYRLANESFCARNALDYSPSKHCTYHLFKDPLYEELGIVVPRFIAKDEYKRVKNKIIKQLKQLKREKRF